MLHHRRTGGKTALKGWYKALEDLVWLTQLGLNMLLPLVLCLAGCWWAVERWNWPEWLFLPAVLLGLAAGAQNFWVFCKERLDRSKKEKITGWASTPTSNGGFFMKLEPGIQKAAAAYRRRHSHLHRSHVGAVRSTASGGVGQV